MKERGKKKKKEVVLNPPSHTLHTYLVGDKPRMLSWINRFVRLGELLVDKATMTFASF